jgi:hypothetical protein
VSRISSRGPFWVTRVDVSSTLETSEVLKIKFNNHLINMNDEIVPPSPTSRKYQESHAAVQGKFNDVFITVIFTRQSKKPDGVIETGSCQILRKGNTYL